MATLNTNFKPFPVLETERLILRKMDFEDTEALFELRSDKRNMEYLDRPLAKTRDDSKALIAKIEEGLVMRTGITWAVAFKNGDNRLVGTIGFWRINAPDFRAEIGYILHRNYHRKGLMHEAMQVVLNYGFREINLHTVEAHVNPFNEGSINLLLKNGFVKEAHFKENYHFEGRFLDTAVYSLITPVTQKDVNS